MLEKTITYTNYNNQKVTRTLRFNLSEAEIIRWNLSETQLTGDGQTGTNGLQLRLERVKESMHGRDIISLLEELLRRGYGVKTVEGGFRKEGVWDEFRDSGAYDQIFMDFLDDPDAFMKFMQGMLPPALMEKAAEETKKRLAAPLDNLERRGTETAQHVQTSDSPLLSRPPHEQGAVQQPRPVEQGFPAQDFDHGSTDYRPQQ